MDVLLLGAPSEERRRSETVLSGTGATVVTCRTSDWGCAALNDVCPLDQRQIDVAVAVDGSDQQGIACATRARIPIVGVRLAADDRTRSQTARTVSHPSELPAATTAAVADVGGYVRAVTNDVRHHVGRNQTLRVEAERRRRSVRITLMTDIDRTYWSKLADSARAGVRRFDERIAVIDVAITSLSS